MTRFMDRSVSSSDFKAHCLEYIAKAHKNNAHYTVTNRGKAVAKLIPIPQESSELEFGKLKNTASIKGSIIEPINAEWDVLNDNS